MILVRPVCDLQPHSPSSTCDCQPHAYIENGVVIVVHMSFDGRELIEEHGLQ